MTPNEDLKKAIKKQNAAFWKLPRLERAVRVAKDVLNQIKAQKYLAQKGCYFSLGYSTMDYQGNFQLALIQREPTCVVCAIGAGFASAARLGDKIAISDDYHVALRDIFSPKTIRRMEAAFEGNGTYFNSRDIKKVRERTMAFRRRHGETSDGLLKAIYKNILKNGGEFKP